MTAEPTFLHVSGVNQARLHSIMQQWVLPSIVCAAYFRLNKIRCVLALERHTCHIQTFLLCGMSI